MTGGTNFDAKVRRESFEPVDLFMPTLGAWTLARGLKIASAIRKDGRMSEFVKQRYGSWDSGISAKIESAKRISKNSKKYMLEKETFHQTRAAARRCSRTF